ncbi:MAG: hypothetical protein NVV70_03840 [Cellulomonas sp.]|nr:hypothetical protein [Cellulomonas sp.]MCR6647300.1 hypothetical protein [Cellulomonas sp.]
MVRELWCHAPALEHLTAIEDATRSVVALRRLRRALHPVVADGAVKQPLERVGRRALARLPLARLARTDAPLSGFEHGGVYERLVCPLGRPNPSLFGGPPHAHLGARRDVLDRDELLVLLLLTPDAIARVRGVREDRADRTVRPATRVAVRVPDTVVLRWRRDAGVSEVLRDGCVPVALDVELEDQTDVGGGDGVGCELVRALPGSGLRGVRVRSDVDELVAVRWPAAEVTVGISGE